ncbi:hypothetical protein [Brevibacillus nitrificans]|uniref:hypothetical protein n=1 Tax=Brevibacillus nitrificans TaxID=651560 RepID=UPI002862A6E5|nr:hypothetical protein [Brevibacillus nitrificans]MDR7314851.1 hypothetical protein [Brevibacillus nitrificans]
MATVTSLHHDASFYTQTQKQGCNLFKYRSMIDTDCHVERVCEAKQFFYRVEHRADADSHAKWPYVAQCCAAACTNRLLAACSCSAAIPFSDRISDSVIPHFGGRDRLLCNVTGNPQALSTKAVGNVAKKEVLRPS